MAISFTDWNNQELRHYGIPGMRKGVRREELLELRRRRIAQAQAQGGGQAQPAQNPSVSREQIKEFRAKAQQMRARRLEMIRRRAEAEARSDEEHGPDEQAISEAIARAQAEGQKRGAVNAAKAAAAAAASKGGPAQQGDPKKRRGGSSNMTVARR